MARVGRLAGALLVETDGAYFLVGQTKEPCDFAAAGLARHAIDAPVRPYVALAVTGPVHLGAPWIEMAVEGELLARLLGERLLIERNGSVSERLWRLVLDSGHDARWLGEIPAAVWAIVRDTVLRCS
jgi:hypothetical protein